MGAREESRQEVEDLKGLFPPQARPVPFSLSYPFVRQNDEMDCGAACLAMVSKHYGNALPVQYWRERVGGDLRGISLYDLATGAEQAGFVCHGLELEDLRRVEDALLPLVAMRAYHYVVVYKKTRSSVVIGDPGVGVYSLSWEDFQRGFEGRVLMLKPTEAFYRVQAPRGRYRHFAQLLKGSEREIVLIFALSVALSGISMLPAFLFQFAIDHILANRDLDLLRFGVVLGTGLTAVLTLAGWIRAYYLTFLFARFDFKASSAFMRKLMSLPYEFFARRHVGDFTHRLAEMGHIRNFLISDVIGQLLALMNLLMYGTVLVWYSPPIAGAVFCAAPILVLLATFWTKRLIMRANEVFAAYADQDGLVVSQIKGIATIKTLGAELAARWRFEEAVVKALRSRYHLELLSSSVGGVSGFVYGMLSMSITALAAWMAIKGHMTTGQVMSVSILAGGVVGPFSALAGLWPAIQEIRNVMDRLNDVFLAEPESRPEAVASGGLRLRGEVEFRDVWFRYGGESSDWVLKGLSFKIEAGQKAAVVGHSGAGKSTVALLVARLFEPTRGQILVDGRDYREYDRQWLRRQVGLLLQETDLFQGTVLDNIAYGDPEPDMERVRRAVDLANAKSFIEGKSAGYDYLITHGGLGLSSGQKQRLALARILYAGPAVLVLDEATSFLDAISAKEVLGALKAATSGRTTISIAHHLGTVKTADVILVIDDGRLAETGTHAQLCKAGGRYAQLFGSEAA